MKTIRLSKGQAKILRYLLEGGEIREREGGFFAEEAGWRMDRRAAEALAFNRYLNPTVITTTGPCSSGLLNSPVLTGESVTERGGRALLAFIDGLHYPDNSDEWYNAVKHGLRERFGWFLKRG